MRENLHRSAEHDAGERLRPSATARETAADIPRSATGEAVDALQRAAGNRAVGALVSGSVALGRHGGAAIQRKCGCSGTGRPCAGCAAKQRLQRKARDGAAAAPEIPPVVGEVLASPGHALDPAMRALMESSFDRDFRDVRLHTDSRAGESADAVEALAYAVGRDVVFGPGQFSTGTRSGRELLAHELAHVVQQAGLGGSGVRGDGATLETQADAAARDAASGRPAAAMAAAPAGLARKPKPKAKEEEVPQRLAASTAAGVVSVTFEGEPLLTIKYDESKGKAVARSEWMPDTGLEAVDIYMPPDSNPNRSVTPLYNDLYAAGTVTLSEYEDTNEYYLVAHPVKAPARRPEPTPDPVKKQEAPPPEPAPYVDEDAQPEEKKKDDKKPDAPPEKLPSKGAEQIIDEHTSWGDLAEDALGAELLKYTLSGDTALAQATLDTVNFTDRDDVAVEFVNHASEEDLIKLAGTADGKRLLARLLDELSRGYEGDDEKAAAQKIQNALIQAKDPAQLVAEAKSAPVIPFSGNGWTKFNTASLDATRLDNGKIRIKSFMKQDHWKYAKHVSTQFALGLDTMELDPDALVGIYNMDEGGKTVYVPAAALLQMSNAEDTKLYMMGGEAVITGLTLGSGGGLLAGAEEGGTELITEAGADTAVKGTTWAARGATALKWGDRIATVAGAANTLITDHRGLIISTYGKDGEDFLKNWQVVQTVLTYYSVGRGAVALGQTAASLRTALKDFKARRAALNLSPADEKALDELMLNTEQTLDDIEKEAPAVKGSGGGSGEPTTGSPARADLDQPDKVLASEPVGGNHKVTITPEGAKLCSPPPCPLLRTQFARELKTSPDLVKELEEVEALRKTDPEAAASRAADLHGKLVAKRRASIPSGAPPDVVDAAMAQLDQAEDNLKLGVGKKRAAQLQSGEKDLPDTPITFDVDEPLAVGAPGVKPQRAYGRATDSHNRQLLDPNTNRATKGVRTSPEDVARHHQKLDPVSVATDPASIFTRRFDEVVELQQVFDEAVAKIPDQGKFKPTALKNEINGNIRDIIQNGRTPAGRAVRDALKAQGFEFQANLGLVAVKHP